jgi:hypothetical protein
MAASSLVAWGVHHALNGNAPFWAAFVGGLVSATVGGGFFLLHLHAPPAGGVFGPPGRGSTSSIPVTLAAGLIALTGPTVALEWANTAPAPAAPDSEGLQPQGGLVPGGGVFVFRGQF